MQNPEYHLMEKPMEKPALSNKALKVAVFFAFFTIVSAIGIFFFCLRNDVNKNDILIVNVGKATMVGTNITLTTSQKFKTEIQALPTNAVRAYKLVGVNDVEKILVFNPNNPNHRIYYSGILNNTNIQSRLIPTSVGSKLVMLRIKDPQFSK